MRQTAVSANNVIALTNFVSKSTAYS